MKKDKFNAKLRDYSRTLSPTASEQNLIKKIYQAFSDILGANNCIQIGSYPRFTSVTPIHDLDILYILGNWDESNHTPATALQSLYNKIQKDFKNPTSYRVQVSLQTHSVTVLFSEYGEEIISIDIVPAYIFAKNSFNEDMYKVPEVIKRNTLKERAEFYKSLATSHKEMSWIKSDPRGYIKRAVVVGNNPDFRKTVKFVKRWKNNLCSADENLKLKSFHLEQVIWEYFNQSPQLEIFDAIFKFFFELPEVIEKPNVIRDIANFDKHIDDYLSKFSTEQKEKIRQARDGFLVKLERAKEADSINNLLEIIFFDRPPSEEFLFDKEIKTLVEPAHDDFSLSAQITDKKGIFQRILNFAGFIDSGRYLKFNKSKNISNCRYEWKVKNDSRSEQPRGEITPNHTKNVPEYTQYIGSHYVECYAIEDNVCIASARHSVILS